MYVVCAYTHMCIHIHTHIHNGENIISVHATARAPRQRFSGSKLLHTDNNIIYLFKFYIYIYILKTIYIYIYIEREREIYRDISYVTYLFKFYI